MQSLRPKRDPSSGSQNMLEFYRGRHLDMAQLYASNPTLTEPFNKVELDSYRMAAMGLYEALKLRGFHKSPSSTSWYAYKTKTRIEKWAVPAVWTLLLLDLFETPQWCNSHIFESVGVCRAADSSQYIMSGFPLLPVGMAVGLESFILLFLFVHFASHVRLYYAVRGHGHATTGGHLILEGTLLVLSDLVQYIVGSSVRIAPLLRFGLAACSELVFSFLRTTVAVSKVGMFFLYTVVIFAWVAATIFDDMEGKDQFGEPINQGFESPPPQRKPRTKTFTKPSALQVQCVPLHLLHYFEHSNLARLHGAFVRLEP
eukprot:symbB.v1.2.039376.t1/scaffold6521.1/size17421/4